ncbi:hypothetical protein H8N00_16980 [Streptomyces sp. AC563]|uniref:tryptophan 2,3-dioxygenase family protein n=1 Tax=Streptomyces buecherae TaxID=2763006 RepID=UPI00164D1CA9|nr:tryptophan 2,3-dioxygenase family protein [Streptomyces buecherae]MBC3990542.1 hypothetical protein [Streptomyces buecherae]
MDSAYAEYLRLPTLLEQQVPRSPVEDTELWASEHFFIVVHQASELLLRQALEDLAAVVRSPGEQKPDWASVETRIGRVARLMTLLRGHLTALRELPREHFHAFRGALGTASGAQSEQFAGLLDTVGVGGDSSPVAQAVVRAAGTPPQVPDRVRDDLQQLGREVRQWQVEHAELVTWMLGEGCRGTGGTTGAAWLRSRIAEPPLDVVHQGGTHGCPARSRDTSRGAPGSAPGGGQAHDS